jgi:hypothetical protein
MKKHLKYLQQKVKISSKDLSQQHVTAFNTVKVSYEGVRTATFCSELNTLN